MTYAPHPPPPPAKHYTDSIRNMLGILYCLSNEPGTKEFSAPLLRLPRPMRRASRLGKKGPWLLKAGWGPLARIEFAISTGIARKDRPAGLVGLVRRSRAAFATAHHPAYANFLRQRLGEEMVDVDEAFEYNRGEEGAHPEAWWRNSYVSVGGDRDGHVDVDKEDSVKTMKLKNAVAVEQGKVSEVNEGRLMERTAAEVARLEDALGRGRKSRIGGVGDRQSGMGRESLSRLHGSPQEGDALLDLGREIIVRRKSQRLTP